MLSFLPLIVALLVGQPSPLEVVVPAPTADAAAQPQPLSQSQLDAIIRQLGDDDFQKRQLAQSQLHSLNESQIAAALPHIAEVYRATHDAEIRMRLRRFGDFCFEQMVLPRYHRLHQSGYLGITPARATLGDGTPVILVATVLPDSPAAAATLHEGDMIAAVDDKPVPDGDSVGAFIQMIQKRIPGSAVRFSVRRGDQTLTLTAKLDPLPDQLQNPQLVEARRDMTQLLHQRWWTDGMLRGRLFPDLPEPAMPASPTAPVPPGDVIYGQ